MGSTFDFRDPIIGKFAEGAGTVMEFPEVSEFGAKRKGQGSLVCLLHTKVLLEVGTQAEGQGPLFKYCNEIFTYFNPFH